jgi:arylsulfatase A-like enzyme
MTDLTPPPRRPDSPWRGVPLALCLGMGLMAVSFTRIAGNTMTEMFHDDVLDATFTGHLFGSALFWNVLGFAAALILLHALYGLICLGLARVSLRAWPAPTVPLYQRTLLAFIALTLWLLASNATRFPHSSLGEPYAKALSVSWAGVTPASCLGWLLVVLTLPMAAAAVRNQRQTGSPASRRRLPAMAAGLLVVVAAGVALPRFGAGQPVQSARPNIILLGIDSLRDDIVDPATSPHTMPHLEAYLSQTVRFSDATTPLARTFPSWVSILTGRRPHVTGAFVNLLPRDLVHEGTTLPALFRRMGYRTEYAIDDVRFSNVDSSYGFDRTVTPPIGASEFVIGFFADTPLSNLVLNTPIGRVLFPFTAANRAVATTYDPDTFIRRIASEFDFHGPLFLAVHLTLPHWPYSWADSPPLRTQPSALATHWPDYYLDATRRADRQFADLLDLLRRKGALDNAIVVVLSDHGESFGTQEDSLVPRDSSEIANLEAFPAWGHGSSVLAPEQYHSVLAVRAFGRTPLGALEARRIDAPVSLEDIAPTLTEAMGIGEHDAFNGQSLLALLRGTPDAARSFAGRIRFTESEFNPGNLASQTGQVSASALAAAAHYYEVDARSDRITVKRDLLGELLHRRQYAALGRDYVVAAIPDPNARRFEVLVADQHGGKPYALNTAPGEQSPAEVRALWAALHTEFGAFFGQGTAAAALTSTAGTLSAQARPVTRHDRN